MRQFPAAHVRCLPRHTLHKDDVAFVALHFALVEVFAG
jgi:hypothetical protein